LVESSKVATVPTIKSFFGRLIGPNSAKNYKFVFELEEQERIALFQFHGGL